MKMEISSRLLLPSGFTSPISISIPDDGSFVAPDQFVAFLGAVEDYVTGGEKEVVVDFANVVRLTIDQARDLAVLNGLAEQLGGGVVFYNVRPIISNVWNDAGVIARLRRAPDQAAAAALFKVK